MILEIVNPETGVPYPSIQHGGRLCVAIPEGEKFAPRAAAQERGRHQIVLAVDGRDTLDNEPASSEADGVVVDGVYTCKGFRISDDEVRSFVCGKLGNDVTTTERNGTVGYAGLVAVAIYREKHRHVMRAMSGVASAVHAVGGLFPTYTPQVLPRPTFTLGDAPGGMQVTCAATPATVQPEPRVMRSRASAPTAGAIAGEVVADRVGRTKWERGDLLGTLVVEYDTPDGWTARGISFERLARAAWPADAAKHCDPQRL